MKMVKISSSTELRDPVVHDQNQLIQLTPWILIFLTSIQIDESHSMGFHDTIFKFLTWWNPRTSLDKWTPEGTFDMTRRRKQKYPDKWSHKKGHWYDGRTKQISAFRKCWLVLCMTDYLNFMFKVNGVIWLGSSIWSTHHTHIQWLNLQSGKKEIKRRHQGENLTKVVFLGIPWFLVMGWWIYLVWQYAWMIYVFIDCLWRRHDCLINCHVGSFEWFSK